MGNKKKNAPINYLRFEPLNNYFVVKKNAPKKCPIHTTLLLF